MLKELEPYCDQVYHTAQNSAKLAADIALGAEGAARVAIFHPWPTHVMHELCQVPFRGRLLQQNMDTVRWQPYHTNSAYTWLTICAFSKDCIWFHLPNELVYKIARMLKEFERIERCIEILSYTARGWGGDYIIFTYDDNYDYEARACLFNIVAPILQMTNTKLILITLAPTA